ncbi:uncharacterized protein PHALS_02037 [Plasmopara halstedii]|uniref:RxLR-like protein n=1 Tax=Plasmopara halstedii TaxID=4781 RepID=A0A0P1AUW6_PLAHL|nr:uncharacterized protein PHALS_02037 [Plasmopara halstedii]CEG45762.1 hypothetical protein PHALS_02037 [Plasmopara halstedii]|eukprot:XP_024582131.1 hypothetical protein PHALS_02037 [Plasmopara halstedii]
MCSRSFTALAATALILIDTTDAHSYMSDPMPTWNVNFPSPSFAGLIDGQKYLPVPDGMSYATDPELITKAYWIAFEASKYTSLKDFADQTMELQTLPPFGKASPECGHSIVNGTARELPDKVKWLAFGLSHQGPCEIWCDKKLAFMDKNCALNYPQDPALLPYDIKICIGAKMMQAYWIALHGLPWQLYLNCVPLKSDGTSAGSSDSPAYSPSKPVAPSTPPASPSTPPASPPTPPAAPPAPPASPPTPPTSPPTPPASPPTPPSPPPTPPSSPPSTPPDDTPEASTGSNDSTPTTPTETPDTSDTEDSEETESEVTPTISTTITDPPTAEHTKCTRRRK